uniref:NADH-ubiquinone oxidoreductase chain 4L n=1 Tax=Paroligoneurus sp. QL-2014 TaxID=1491722 RepID=A0A0U1WH25_9HYME|nr:NADH dehydrogenase subunit 4L [Paroligoneurus sp. QL-2014]
MILLNLNISMILFMLSALMFLISYKHILINLINMEFMIMNLIFNMFMNLMIMKTNMYFLSMFLTIAVCESVMGLSILVYLINSKGNDYFNLLNIMKW